MKALITGASGGIGRDMAIILSNMGYDLILVARSKDKLDELKEEISTKCTIIATDLSDEQNCFDLYKKTKDENIDILINNAGYGIHGYFKDSPIENDLNMINLNVKSVQILTKLFLNDFIEKDSGRILNVSSSAGLTIGGPLFASYYATKAYVSSLTRGIYGELKSVKSNVTISHLCPGPVDTGFNKRAGISKFSSKPLDSKYVSEYAINKMLKGKLTIIPGFKMKVAMFFSKFVGEKLMLRILMSFQKGKEK
ncbi:MAG: SDR family NAD(P)-dependent oxidoreductase [Oscillospiraceae bacterium]|nr:SDR family NAD(P)-dependent oxidoreductase [Oscillospiraceae bacterium]